MHTDIADSWSVFITATTLVGIVACLVLLWFSGKTHAMSDKVNTTGHVWDGDLREMNNPLPRWWVWLSAINVVFALVYLALYPGLGSRDGSLKWTSEGQHAAEIAKTRASMAPRILASPSERCSTPGVSITT